MNLPDARNKVTRHGDDKTIANNNLNINKNRLK